MGMQLIMSVLVVTVTLVLSDPPKDTTPGAGMYHG